jgi:intein/homing endonuclease
MPRFFHFCILLPLLLILSNHSSGIAASVQRDVNLEVKNDCSQRINCLSSYENNNEFECVEPISQLKVGDEVLALSEWKTKGIQTKGSKAKTDQRLSYEKVTDVFSSHKEQNLIHITLDNGETLTATEGHPFKTTEGWRDTVMLKKGGKLLLKGGDEAAADDADKAATIIDIRTEIKVLPVFNLEVANAHTFFVGRDGELVHNGRCGVKPGKYWRKEYEKREGKPWPQTDDGKNYHAHHKEPLADKGKDVYENIMPMHPDAHRDHHAEDRRRWGRRK